VNRAIRQAVDFAAALYARLRSGAFVFKCPLASRSRTTIAHMPSEKYWRAYATLRNRVLRVERNWTAGRRCERGILPVRQRGRGQVSRRTNYTACMRRAVPDCRRQAVACPPLRAGRLRGAKCLACEFLIIGQHSRLVMSRVLAQPLEYEPLICAGRSGIGDRGWEGKQERRAMGLNSICALGHYTHRHAKALRYGSAEVSAASRVCQVMAAA